MMTTSTTEHARRQEEALDEEDLDRGRGRGNGEYGFDVGAVVGLSRNERSGYWTLYDRRDSRPYDGSDGAVSSSTERFVDAAALANALLEGEPAYDPTYLIGLLDEHDHPAIQELRVAVEQHGKDALTKS